MTALRCQLEYREMSRIHCSDVISIILSHKQTRFRGLHLWALSFSFCSVNLSQVLPSVTYNLIYRQLFLYLSALDELYQYLVRFFNWNVKKFILKTDGRPVVVDPHHIIIEDPDGSCTLILDNMNADDSGQYMCFAVSSAGNASTLGKITVQGGYHIVKIRWFFFT